MKKWIFVIVPGILLVIFLFYYNQEINALHARQQARAEAAAQAKQKADDEQAKAQQQARLDAKKRAEEQAAEQAAAEKKREDDWEADTAKIQGQIDQYTNEANRFAKRVSALEIELDTLHKQQDEVNRADFNLLKEVQLERVAQQNAEMDIQRMVAMIVNRTNQSSFTQMPPPPPPPKD